jgi:hypothetical protein
VRTLDPGRLVTRLALNYYVYKVVQRGDEWVDVECWFPRDSAEHALNATDVAVNLRRLKGVTHTPMVRRDGTILDAPGYDDATGFLYLPAVDVDPVPVSPTAAEVGAAVTLLRGIVAEFKWAGKHDEANFHGLLLTPLLRELCPPPYKLGAIMAHQPGSGKGLLNRILRDVHGGVFRSEMPHDDAELAKSITGILTQTTAPVVQFDNVSGTLRSSRLAGLLTSAVYSDRVLGSTNNADMINDRLWTITGNNLNLGGDLVRRTVWVTIDPGCPDPHLRTGFKLDIPRYIADNRGRILHALLTLVAAWVSTGKPLERRSSDDYALWSATVRGILTHTRTVLGEDAGIPGEFDHVDSAQQAIGTDDEGWGDFLRALRQGFEGRIFTTRDVIDRMGKAGWAGEDVATDLVEALPGPLHEQQIRTGSVRGLTRSLGRWFMNRDGRWVTEFCLVKAGHDGTRNVPYWRVKVFGE